MLYKFLKLRRGKDDAWCGVAALAAPVYTYTHTGLPRNPAALMSRLDRQLLCLSRGPANRIFKPIHPCLESGALILGYTYTISTILQLAQFILVFHRSLHSYNQDKKGKVSRVYIAV
jgi:hypothetical protein